MRLDFDKMGGLIPVVVQEHATGQVLMLGFMNAAALEATRGTGEVTFFSRSRNRLWVKGEQSGHRLRLKALHLDCDADALLATVEMLGPGVCHQGYRSCFYRRLEPAGPATVIASRAFDPAAAYGGGDRR